MKYRKRPVVIDAHQWHRNGDHPDDRVGEPFRDLVTGEQCLRIEGVVVRFFRRPDVPGVSSCSECGRPFDDHGWIDTLEDGHRVCPSDWIITGVRGERYPCKDSIFRETYEPAEDAA